MAHPVRTRTSPVPAPSPAPGQDRMWAQAGRQRLMLLDRRAERIHAEHDQHVTAAHARHQLEHTAAKATLDQVLRTALAGVTIGLQPESGAPVILGPEAAERTARATVAFVRYYDRITTADAVLEDEVNRAAAALAQRLDAIARARASVPVEQDAQVQA